MLTDSISKWENPVCPNTECEYKQYEEGKYVIKRGKNKAGHQRYYCCNCKRYFVETTGTFRYHKHLSDNELAKICMLLAESSNIREIERRTGHHRDTIGRLLEKMALNVEETDDFFIEKLKLEKYEAAKIWLTILRNKRKLNDDVRKILLKKRNTYINELSLEELFIRQKEK